MPPFVDQPSLDSFYQSLAEALDTAFDDNLVYLLDQVPPPLASLPAAVHTSGTLSNGSAEFSLHNLLDDMTIPTWRDVPTGDEALDSDGEDMEDYLLLEQQLETQPPLFNLYASEEQLLPTQDLTFDDYTDVSDLSDDDECLSQIDFTEEIYI